jgi:predicted nucleic acid-binding protein
VIVVADTSVVLNLVRVGHDRLLREIYREVWIPAKMAEEFGWQTSINPRFRGLQLPSWLQIRNPATVPEFLRANKLLDDGERAALALAVEIHADAILIDEENGREIAMKLGLDRVGILGILLRAKAEGLVPSLKPIFETLQREANFWISEPLREHVLRLAGESP